MARRWITTDSADPILPDDVRVATRLPRVNIRRFGVVADGVTDDTAAFQDAIDELPFGSGVPPFALDFDEGILTLSDTIEINRKAVTLLGLGVGNPPDHGNPGRGSTVRWAGSAGSPMFHFLDSRHIYMRGIYIQGDNTNPPSEGFYFEGAGGSTGTNEYLVFEQMLFGYLPWNVGGYGMDICVRFGGGTNANNDQFTFRNCQFMRPNDVCFQIDNSQSIWGSFEDSFMDCNGLGAKGLVTSAAVTMYNAQFNGCDVDIEINSTAKVDVFGFQSENSLKLVDITGGGGQLIVRGGKVLLSDIVGGYYITAGALAGGRIDLAGWDLNTGSASPRPQIQVITGSMAGAATNATSLLSVRSCGTTADDYDVSSIANGRIDIRIDDQNIHDRIKLRGVAVYDPKPDVDENLDVLSTGELLPHHDALVGFGANNLATLTSQALRLVYFTGNRTETITQISSYSGGTAAAATPTLCRLGIYEIASNGDGTLIASTANDTALWATINTLYTKSFSVAFSKVRGQRYAYALLCVTAAAAPVMISPNVGTTGLPDGVLGLATGGGTRRVGTISGQADLPSTFTAASVANSKIAPTVRLVP